MIIIGNYLGIERLSLHTHDIYPAIVSNPRQAGPKELDPPIKKKKHVAIDVVSRAVYKRPNDPRESLRPPQAPAFRFGQSSSLWQLHMQIGVCT